MCSIENLKIMKLLLDNGVDVNLKNKLNMTALTMAVIANKEDAVKLLIDYGADVDIPSTLNNKTPLMYAMENKNENISKILQKKTKSKMKDAHGNTMLLYAISSYQIDIEKVKSIISKTNQINVFNDLGISALFKAIKFDNLELVKLLVENGADINLKNKNGVSALITARKTNNNPQMIELLKEYGTKE